MIPSDLILPLEGDRITSGDPALLATYVRELLTSLTEAYQNVSQGVNGTIEEYLPVLVGNTTPGTGTYTSQKGWYLRKVLTVDYWFDVTWSAHTGTGNLYIRLPYKVKLTEGSPFVGLLNMSNLTLTASYTDIFMIAESNSFKGNVMQKGSGQPIINLAMPASGRILGHIRYLGQEFE